MEPRIKNRNMEYGISQQQGVKGDIRNVFNSAILKVKEEYYARNSGQHLLPKMPKGIAGTYKMY